MDGLFPSAAHVSSATANGVFGILYAEDFDDPADLDAGLAEHPVEPPPLPAITQADVDTACAAAVRAARLEWQAGQEQARLDAIKSLNGVLGAIRDTAERATLAAAEGTVTTILSMIAGLLPQFSREHGPAEVRAMLDRLLPALRSQERVSVRVHPELVAPLQRDLATMDDGLAEIVDIVAAPLEPGDVRASWQNGALVRDTKQIMQSIQDALGALGLHQTTKPAAKRKMAYAD